MKSGRYLINYENGVIEELPIVLGQDVWDMWVGPDKIALKEDGKPNIAWASPDPVDGNGKRVGYSQTSWRNPHPEMKITTLDFVIGKTLAAPFLVALTVE